MEFLETLQPGLNHRAHGDNSTSPPSSQAVPHPETKTKPHEHFIDRVLGGIGGDKGDAAQTSKDTMASSAQPNPAAAATSPVPAEQSRHELMGKLADALHFGGSAEEQREAQSSTKEHEQKHELQSAAVEQKEHHGLLHKLSSNFTTTQQTLNPQNPVLARKPESVPPLTTAPVPEAGPGPLEKLQGALGLTHEHSQAPTVPSHPPPVAAQAKQGFFGNIFGDPPAPAPMVLPPQPAPSAEHGHEGLKDIISGVFDGGKKKREEEAAEERRRIAQALAEEEARKREHHHHVEDALSKLGLGIGHYKEQEQVLKVSESSLLDRIGFAVGHTAAAVQPQAPPKQEPEHDSGSLVDRVGDAIGLLRKDEEKKGKSDASGKAQLEGQSSIVDKIEVAVHDIHHNTPWPGHSSKEDSVPPKDTKLVDKIENALGHGLHRKSEEPPRRTEPETLVEKLESVVHYHRLHREEEKEVSLQDRISSALGFQEKKKKEDGLDKTIDFVQEHILHQGTQSNESFVEQMKDEQIAKAIRAQYKYATGHEFPIKEHCDKDK